MAAVQRNCLLSGLYTRTEILARTRIAGGLQERLNGFFSFFVRHRADSDYGLRGGVPIWFVPTKCARKRRNSLSPFDSSTGTGGTQI
eukprot:9482358-Pyramimonas_sp.AAC.4